MTTIPMDRISDTQIQARCVGCGEQLFYTLSCDGGAPTVQPPFGAIAYKGGHVCDTCARRLAVAITPRRTKRGHLTFCYANGLRTCRVSSPESAATIWDAYRDRMGSEQGIGGVSALGNGGDVLDDDGNVIAHISYNGRIWPKGA